MAITILLCSTGVLPIYMGIALVMGENIGTTATANLAALGAGTEARRAALAHLLFNVFGVIWVLLVFYPFVDMVCHLVGYNPALSGQAPRIPVVLAMFHTCFNVTNTLLLIGFIPQFERVVRWLLPQKTETAGDGQNLKYIQAGPMATPEIAVFEAEKETTLFAERMHAMFAMVTQLMDDTHADSFDEKYAAIEREEDISDKTEQAIADYLAQLSNDHLSDTTKQKIRQMLREVSELESIGDACYKIGRTLARHRELSLAFVTSQSDNLHMMRDLTNNALQQMCKVMHGHRSEHNINETYRIENEVNLLRNRLKEENIQAINNHEYSYALGTLYFDIISEMEKLCDYIVNVVEARFGK
jgi:phosphate:Na+ symporter